MGFRKLYILYAFVLQLALATLPAYTAPSLSKSEFHSLANELSKKVDLFQETWKKDPAAEFYGGTTRDFLYWLKGQFTDSRSKEQVIQELRARQSIPVREFLMKESDVDIVTTKELDLVANDYSIRKIDKISPEIFNFSSDLGKNELYQGYIPAEKIRLGAQGFRAPDKLGDGMTELYDGKLSVHFASPTEFATTKYAREGVNHPVLLALRFLRLQATNYFREHGRGAPDTAKLKAAMSTANAHMVKQVIEDAAKNGALRPYLVNSRFRTWMNGTIRKAFEGYTNPDAALALMKEFEVDRLASIYGSEIEPFYNYVFVKKRDPAKITSHIASLGFSEKALYDSVDSAFPDHFLYHGTKDDGAFRSILFYGVLQSEDGSAGKGLYGVNQANQKFSENWAGDKKRLIRLPVDLGAKLVDITKGDGKRAWDAYIAKFGESGAHEGFADFVGADILRYPYNGQDAYVVKNAGILGKAEGVHRKVLPLHLLEPELAKATSLIEFLDLADMNSLSRTETEKYLSPRNFPSSEFRALFENTITGRAKATEMNRRFIDQLSLHSWIQDEKNFRFLLEDEDLGKSALDYNLKKIGDLNKQKKFLQIAAETQNTSLQVHAMKMPLYQTQLIGDWSWLKQIFSKEPINQELIDAFYTYIFSASRKPNVTPLPKELTSKVGSALTDSQANVLMMIHFSEPESVREQALFEQLLRENKGTFMAPDALNKPHWVKEKKLRTLLAQADPKAGLRLLKELAVPDIDLANQLLKNGSPVVDETIAYLKWSPVWQGQLNFKVRKNDLRIGNQSFCERAFGNIGQWWRTRRIYELLHTGKVPTN